jgi:hypothetical protein
MVHPPDAPDRKSFCLPGTLNERFVAKSQLSSVRPKKATGRLFRVHNSFVMV